MTGGVEHNRPVEGGPDKRTESAPVIGSGGTVFGAERTVRPVTHVLPPHRESGVGRGRIEHTLQPGVEVDLPSQVQQQQGQAETDPTESADEPRVFQLSERQREVLQRRAHGLSYDEIDASISRDRHDQATRMGFGSSFEAVVSAVVTGEVEALPRDPDIEAKISTLSPREQQIAERLVANNGRVNDTEALADALGINKKTINVHIHNMIKKLGASSRLDAAIKIITAERRPWDPVEEIVLPDRQKEVVQLRAHGLSYPEIKAQTGLSRSTIVRHIEDLQKRMGAESGFEATVTAAVTGLVDPLPRDPDIEAKISALLPREQQVVKMLVANNGRVNDSPALADVLGINKNTVDVHIHNILRKLGASSRLDAVIMIITAEYRPWDEPVLEE